MSETNSPRTRRYVLGCAAAGLAGTSIPALAQEEQNKTETLQQTEPDGHIITFPDCETAVVEGNHWDEIRFGGAVYSPENGFGDYTEAVQPDESGVTVIDGTEYSYGGRTVIEDVTCLIQHEDTYITAASRSRSKDSECFDRLTPTTTTETETTTTTETTTDETTTPEPFDPRAEFDGCSHVTISKDRYTVVELTFTDRSTEVFRGEWTEPNTFTGFGENAGKDIMEVRVSDGESNAWFGNPNGCANDEVTPDTTTTELIVTPHDEPTTTTTTTTTAEETTSANRGWLSQSVTSIVRFAA